MPCCSSDPGSVFCVFCPLFPRFLDLPCQVAVSYHRMSDEALDRFQEKEEVGIPLSPSSSSSVSVTSPMRRTSTEKGMAGSTAVIVDLETIKVDFTELPPQKLLCPDCGKVFRDPQLFSCCKARSSCRTCIQGLKEAGAACPSCREASWESEADGETQRSVNELYVRCLHVTDGCLWFGHLEHLPRHIERENKSGCVFIKLPCPHDCGEKQPRKFLEDHAKNKCPNRPYKCEYCKEAEGTYKEVSTVHFATCRLFPLPCPNKCPEGPIPRSSYENHIKNSCKYQDSLPCPLAAIGCTAKMRRDKIPIHLEKGVASHMMLLAESIIKGKQELESKLESLPPPQTVVAPPPTPPPQTLNTDEIDAHFEELLKSKDDEIFRLKRDLAQLAREKDRETRELKTALDKAQHTLEMQEKRLSLAEQLSHTLTRDLGVLRQFIPSPLPLTFTINKVSQLRQSDKWWYSRPFYSHVQGYKFGMFVFCNGVLDGKGTHMSVFLYLVRGEYDNDLDWPFRGNVTIHLLNQRSDRQHYQKVIRFTDDTPTAVCNRVIDAEMAKEGNGPTQFISQGDLTYNQEKDTEFIRDDCLKIRVASISLKTSAPRTPAPGGGANTGTLSRSLPTDSMLIRAQTQSIESNGDSIASPVTKSPSPRTSSTTPVENGHSS